VSIRAPIRVGTAGWSVPSRYLSEIPAGGSHLERYSRAFPIVEIDTSFYKSHRKATYERWASSVGEEFRFAVKTPRALTHDGRLGVGTGGVLDQFLAEIEGLGQKLDVLLVQLPPSLGFNGREARSFFGRLRRHVPPGVRIACEPRHGTWSSGAVNNLLQKLGVSRVAVDPARWTGGPGAEGDTGPGGDRRLSYFRMHGSPRIYFSDYDVPRLEALHGRLDVAARDSDAVWCIFDNTAHGHATGNALWLQRAVRQAVRHRR
jgi:uncharacterized protein YecE (DUF72 family)